MPPLQSIQAPIPAAPKQQVAPGITTAEHPLGPGRLLGAIDRTRGGEADAAVIRRELKMQLHSEADWK